MSADLSYSSRARSGSSAAGWAVAGRRSAKYPPFCQSVPGRLADSYTRVSAPRSGDRMARRSGEDMTIRTAGGPDRPHWERTMPG
jgi:hypothetical protein